MVILYCLRFVFISESGNKALMLSIDLLIELYFKMPMFNLFSEVNILECINNRNIIGTCICIYGFFITNLLHSLFAKIPEITNDLIFEVAFRKLEKLPSLNYFIDKYTKQKS